MKTLNDFPEVKRLQGHGDGTIYNLTKQLETENKQVLTVTCNSFGACDTPELKDLIQEYNPVVILDNPERLCPPAEKAINKLISECPDIEMIRVTYPKAA